MINIMCHKCDEAEKLYEKARDERARVYHMYERVRQEYYVITDNCQDNN